MTQLFQKQAFYPHFPVSSNLSALSNELKVLHLWTAGPIDYVLWSYQKPVPKEKIL